jgi:Isochorismatase family
MSTAILVIDMQNGFCHEQGSLPLAGLGLPNMPSVVAANQALLAEARVMGLPVYYTRHVFRPDFLDVAPRAKALLPLDPPPLVRGSWDGAIIGEQMASSGCSSRGSSRPSVSNRRFARPSSATSRSLSLRTVRRRPMACTIRPWRRWPPYSPPWDLGANCCHWPR